jgi:hypothetical protein
MGRDRTGWDGMGRMDDGKWQMEKREWEEWDGREEGKGKQKQMERRHLGCYGGRDHEHADLLWRTVYAHEPLGGRDTVFPVAAEMRWEDDMGVWKRELPETAGASPVSPHPGPLPLGRGRIRALSQGGTRAALSMNLARIAAFMRQRRGNINVAWWARSVVRGATFLPHQCGDPKASRFMAPMRVQSWRWRLPMTFPSPGPHPPHEPFLCSSRHKKAQTTGAE